MSVVLSTLAPGEVSLEFYRSVVNLLAWDDKHRRLILDGGGHLTIPSGPNLSGPRNSQARTFLRHDADWLWIVDSDMAFDPDTLDRLVDAAHPSQRPIVGALCFGQRSENGVLRYFPTMYREEDGRYRGITDYPEGELVEVAATGTACLLVHRSVLEAMEARYPEPFPWFAEEINALGGIHSEDITFCLRARALGVPVHVHTGVRTGHVKRYLLTESLFLDRRGSS